MKLFVHYKPTTGPTGGGNTFITDFLKFCKRNNVSLANNINDDYDILFFNGGFKAPRHPLDLNELLEQKFIGRSGPFRVFQKRRKGRILVYRADGFRCIYAGISRDYCDTVQRCSLQLADQVVFQNNWSVNMMKDEQIGFHGTNYSVIYNGIDQEMFNLEGKEYWDGNEPLRIFSASWSSNANKGFKELADLSTEPNTIVTFCGNWPQSIESQQVNLIKPLSRDALAKEYKKHHVFMLVSRHDTSPNACLEAVSSGLPLVYAHNSGVSEVLPDCGVAYDELDGKSTFEEVRERYKDLLQNVLSRREFFSMERCGKEYLQFFESLL